MVSQILSVKSKSVMQGESAIGSLPFSVRGDFRFHPRLQTLRARLDFLFVMAMFGRS